jgi:hypothetical protein
MRTLLSGTVAAIVAELARHFETRSDRVAGRLFVTGR